MAVHDWQPVPAPALAGLSSFAAIALRQHSTAQRGVAQLVHCVLQDAAFNVIDAESQLPAHVLTGMGGASTPHRAVMVGASAPPSAVHGMTTLYFTAFTEIKGSVIAWRSQRIYPNHSTSPPSPLDTHTGLS